MVILSTIENSPLCMHVYKQPKLGVVFNQISKKVTLIYEFEYFYFLLYFLYLDIQ